SAVGLPHPSDAATASAGRPLRSASEYRFDVIGSSHPHVAGLLHVDADDSLTAAAIARYFSFTACWTSDMVELLICARKYTWTVGMARYRAALSFSSSRKSASHASGGSPTPSTSRARRARLSCESGIIFHAPHAHDRRRHRASSRRCRHRSRVR